MVTYSDSDTEYGQRNHLDDRLPEIDAEDREQIANFLAKHVWDHPTHIDNDKGFVESRGGYQLRHVSDDESADEENVVPHNVSEVQQLRYVEFYDKNYDTKLEEVEKDKTETKIKRLKKK